MSVPSLLLSSFSVSTIDCVSGKVPFLEGKVLWYDYCFVVKACGINLLWMFFNICCTIVFSLKDWLFSIQIVLFTTNCGSIWSYLWNCYLVRTYLYMGTQLSLVPNRVLMWIKVRILQFDSTISPYLFCYFSYPFISVPSDYKNDISSSVIILNTRNPEVNVFFSLENDKIFEPPEYFFATLNFSGPYNPQVVIALSSKVTKFLIQDDDGKSKMHAFFA